MEEKSNILACYTLLFQERKSTAETQRKIYAVCGEGAVTDPMCYQWLVKFCAGDFSLDNPPWLGRPVKLMAIRGIR